MRAVSFLAGLLGSALTGSALAVPLARDTTSAGFTKVTPGGIEDRIVTKENTLNGTYQGETRIVHAAGDGDASASATVNLRFVNNFGGSINAYVTGLAPNGGVAFLRADGTLVYPSSGGSTTPVTITDDIAIPLTAGQELEFALPIALESGRIYFAEGELTFAVVSTETGEGLVQPAPNNLSDPSAGVNWGFVELTLNPDNSIYTNISYVDFLGLPLGIELTVNDGDTQSAFGVDADAVASACSALQAQTASDGFPWDQICLAGDNGPVRALSPTQYTDIDPEGFATYWDQYRDEVWAKYTSQPLIINTQTDAGGVNCLVTDDTLNCDGDNRGYSKPTAADIWGCNSGPFGKIGDENAIHLAVIPRLCAAFVRSTLLLDGGDVQPSLDSTNYYTVDPTNHYSRVVHDQEVDGKGYAFAYDDVNPEGVENASGTLSSASPNTLSVYIGAPPV